MRIFVYVLKFDSGFAPNPFHGWCTLACCKPAIRRTSRPGDWIVGLTPRALGNRVAYAMRVAESLSFEEYWSDPRFKSKRPRWKKGASRVSKRAETTATNRWVLVSSDNIRPRIGITSTIGRVNRTRQKTSVASAFLSRGGSATLEPTHGRFQATYPSSDLHASTALTSPIRRSQRSSNSWRACPRASMGSRETGRRKTRPGSSGGSDAVDT